jgi:tetratricopeptide (TPR) repeat protein
MALVLHLSDETLWLAKAKVLMELGKLDVAKRAADRGCKLSHNEWEPHLLCADILYKMKDYQSALEQIDLALEYGAKSAQALTLKGILVSIIDQDFHQALGFFDNAIGADEEYGRAWSNRGMALKQIGDEDGALYSFQKALLINRDDKNSRTMIEKMGHSEYLDALDGKEDEEEEDEDSLDWEEMEELDQ